MEDQGEQAFIYWIDGYNSIMEFYEEAYFYNRRLTFTFKGMEARYR
jgi:hypothetical protein